jgi:Holliday junction DNA helicase RuvA
MIARIKGLVSEKEERSIILDVHNIGYRVFVTSTTLDSIKVGSEIDFFVHHAIREDSQSLYGFITKDDLALFELLISISGIGPKTALGVLSVSSAQNIRRAVSTGDTSHLTKVSGIGSKLANKIILELKGKFDAEEESNISLRDEVDALEALKALGFGHKEARDALKEVSTDTTNTGERVKKALKLLGK